MNDYQNSSLPIQNRVNDLLGRMTLQEKIGQVNQHLYGWKCYQKSSKDNYSLTSYFKEHVKWGNGIGALYGVLRADPWSKVNFKNGISLYNSQKLTNKIQEYVIEHSRLHIPVLFVEECPHGHQALESPSFPTNIGKGNSFDSSLIKQMAAAESDELKAKGINLALVSTLDLAKDPRWGRTEECFGEDPYLSAQFSEAIVQGFQGDLINEKNKIGDKIVNSAKKHVGVVLKHFIAQGEVLGGHNSGSVNLGKNEFINDYEPLIHSCRNAAGIMAAYNDIDGIPCHVNEWLLKEKLRQDHGFQGIVMADGTALDRLSDFYPDESQAVKAALSAGIDISLWDNLFLNIEKAVKIYPELLKDLNQSVSRVLTIKFLLGLFDNPYTNVTSEKIDQILQKENEINKQLSLESMTLVKNEHNILPIKKKTKAVIVGPSADSCYNLLGDYSAPQKPKIEQNTIYSALKEKMPSLKYTLGCQVRSKQTMKQKLMVEEASKDSDLAILVLGGSSSRRFDDKFFNNGALSSKSANMDCGENVDVASLQLGGSQIGLLKQLKKSGKKIITILIQGRPYDISEILSLSDAVLLSWYPGNLGPQAVTDILLGDYNPEGKLSISYPINSSQLPVYYYQRDSQKNENYYDESGSPKLEFGYGLHYGQIKADINSLSFTSMVSGEVTIDLLNRSKMKVHETLLMFAQIKKLGEIPQKWRLIKFEKISLNANERKKLTLNFKIPVYCSIDEIYQTKVKLYNQVFENNKL